MPCWKRLNRFIADEDGKEHYRESTCPIKEDVGKVFLKNPKSLKATIIKGDPLSDICSFVSPSKALTVRKLLAPVDVQKYGASLRCLGTNYPIGGAKKTVLPILFFKPFSSLAGFGDKIIVPKEVQDQSDYEVELVIVIGKEGKNIPLEMAFEHVVGYTICNDVSARKRMFATPQWGMGKCYDGWLPIGPSLVSSSVLTPSKAQALPPKTSLSTHSSLLQDGNTSDQLWKIAETVSALSYGTTLRVGDLICTGTPDGQGSNRKPQVWLQDKQVITVGKDDWKSR